jgi:hypothetical protein
MILNHLLVNMQMIHSLFNIFETSIIFFQKFRSGREKSIPSSLKLDTDQFNLKSGIYVPMNVFNMCCYCLRHLKIQNGHQRRSKFALKPYGKQHFHSWSNRSSAHLEQKSTQVRIMGITNCPMHNNDSTQCVGLVSTNQDNFLGQDRRDSSEIIYFQLHTLIHSFLILQSHTNDDP